MDRRTLLKSAAALSAAAALPTAAPMAEAAEAVPAPAVVASVKTNPYTKYVWQWFVSHDGETYYEGFDTKDEAVKYAQQCDYSLVAECVQQDFRLDIDGYRLLEELNESNYDLIGEGEGIECTNDQRLDLEKMVQQAIEAWIVKHNIDITAWSFDDVRNKTDVPMPSPSLPSHNRQDAE